LIVISNAFRVLQLSFGMVPLVKTVLLQIVISALTIKGYARPVKPHTSQYKALANVRAL
jgi:hypothetical protein